MANALRGEVDLVVGDGGKTKTYVVRLSINAMVEVETITGLGIGDIIVELQDKPKLGTLRSLLWAGLREKQPKVTLADAGEIMGEIGFEKTAEIVGDAMTKAFPAKEGDRPSLETTQD